MRGYWIKIVAKALGIFAVGLLVIFAVRKVSGGVGQLVHGTGDVSINLFGLVPFAVTGHQFGNLRRLQIHRDTPKHVTGFRLVARLDDSVDTDRFEECFFTLRDASHINQNTTFTCLDSIPPGMREFGEMQFVDSDGEEDLRRPIILEEGDIADFQNSGGQADGINVDSITTAAESAGEAGRRMGDSIRRVMQQRYGRSSGAANVAPTPPPVPPAAHAPTKAKPHAAPQSRATVAPPQKP